MISFNYERYEALCRRLKELDQDGRMFSHEAQELERQLPPDNSTSTPSASA